MPKTASCSRPPPSLETTGYTDAVLLDKTGTVTTGEPSVVRIIGTRNVPEKFLLSMAARSGAAQ